MTATEIRREEMMYEMRQNSHLHRFGKFYLKNAVVVSAILGAFPFSHVNLFSVQIWQQQSPHCKPQAIKRMGRVEVCSLKPFVSEYSSELSLIWMRSWSLLNRQMEFCFVPLEHKRVCFFVFMLLQSTFIISIAILFNLVLPFFPITLFSFAIPS